MRKRRAAFIAAGVAAALAATTACGSSDDSGGSDAASFDAKPSGTMSYWGFNNADDVGKARLDYAAKQLEGVKLEADQTGFDAQKFTTRLTSGNVPDVVQMSRDQVLTYAAQDLLMPLEKCFEANKVDPKERWYASILPDVTYKDKMWAVPQFYQPPAIILNRSVMEAAGVQEADLDTSNPDKLVAAIGKMYKANGDVPATLGLNPEATGQINLWLVGQGGRVADESGKPTLDDPNNVAALELLKKITDAQGGFAKVKSFVDSFDKFGEKNQFVTNQVGAEVDAQWYPNVLSPFKDKVKLSAVPFKDKSGNPITVAGGGTAFVIPAKAKNPAAACKWALSLTEEGSWTAAAEARAKTVAEKKSINTGLFTGSPATDKAIREKYVKPSGNADFDKVIATYYEIVDKGKHAGSSPAGQQITQEMLNAVTATLLGKKPAQQALADAQTAAMTAYNTVAGG